jgi:hypothetical protein
MGAGGLMPPEFARASRESRYARDLDCTLDGFGRGYGSVYMETRCLCLMTQVQSIREKLLALDPQHSNKKEVRTLPDAQATLLAKFIVANARMQSEIYRLLRPEQQRKLDELKRNGESGTVASR